MSNFLFSWKVDKYDGENGNYEKEEKKKNPFRNEHNCYGQKIVSQVSWYVPYSHQCCVPPALQCCHCKAPPQAPLNFSLNCVNAANDGFILLKIYIENNYNYTIQIIHLKKNVEIIHGISLHIF